LKAKKESEAALKKLQEDRLKKSVEADQKLRDDIKKSEQEQRAKFNKQRFESLKKEIQPSQKKGSNGFDTESFLNDFANKPVKSKQLAKAKPDEKAPVSKVKVADDKQTKQQATLKKEEPKNASKLQAEPKNNTKLQAEPKNNTKLQAEPKNKTAFAEPHKDAKKA